MTLSLLPGCSREERAPAPDPAASSPAPGSAGAAAPAEPRPSGRPAKAAGAPLVLASGVRFVKAGADSDVARLVRNEREGATADGRVLIVYVGATWCEPCRRFHEAAQRGELDDAFPDLSILEFDLDEDRDRLVSAGYVSKLIPLFVFPREDGRASERRFEGGIKGDQAVGNITARLRTLLHR